MGQSVVVEERRSLSLSERERASLAKNLKALRLAKPMTMRALDRRSGVDESQISRIESGRAGARQETVRRLADALGVPLRSLLARAIRRPNADVGPPPKRDRLSAQQVARRLRVSVQTVYGWRRRGWLRAISIGGRRWFARDDVDTFVRRGADGPQLIVSRPGTVFGSLRREEIYD